MSEVAVKFTGDEADLWRALQRVITQGVKTEAGIEGIGRTSRKADADLARFAERTRQITSTPVEKYQQQMGRLDEALRKGLVSQETYNRAVDAAKPPLDRAEQDARELAQRVKELSVDPVRRYQDEVKKLDDLLKRGLISQREHTVAVQKAGEAMRNTGTAGQSAFGPGSLSMLTSFAGGLAGIVGVANTVVGTLGQINDEMKKLSENAAQALEQAADPMAQLAQLASSPEEMAGLVDASKKTRAEGGAKTLGDAARMTFALQSAGLLDERALFSQMGATGLAGDPGATAKSVATLITAMGKGETGGGRDVLSKALGAAKFSPATMEQIIEGTARAGTAGAALGMSDEELMAATSVVSGSTGSADTAGSRVAALLRGMDKTGEFQGVDLATAVKDIMGRGMDGEELQKFLGSSEAIDALRTLSQNMDTFGSAIAEINQAQRTDAVGQKLELAGGIPEISSVLGDRQAAGEMEIKTLDLGTAKKLVDEVIKEQQGDRLDQYGTGWFGRAAAGSYGWRAGSRRAMTGDIAMLRSYEENAADKMEPETLQKVREFLADWDRKQPGASADGGLTAAQQQEQARLQREIADRQRHAAESLDRSAGRLERATERMEQQRPNHTANARGHQAAALSLAE